MRNLKQDAMKTFTIVIPMEMVVDGKVSFIMSGGRIAYAPPPGRTTSFTEFWNSSISIYS